MKENITDQCLWRYIHKEMDWKEVLQIRRELQNNPELQSKLDDMLLLDKAIKPAISELESKTKHNRFKMFNDRIWKISTAIAASLFIFLGIRFIFPASELTWEQTSITKSNTDYNDLIETIDSEVCDQVDEYFKKLSIMERRYLRGGIMRKRLRIQNKSTLTKNNFIIEVWDANNNIWNEVTSYDPSNTDIKDITKIISSELIYSPSER